VRVLLSVMLGPWRRGKLLVSTSVVCRRHCL